MTDGGDTENYAGAAQKPDADPDAELMKRCAAGSDDAFTEIVRRHQRALLNFFARMGALSDGEDLVQETFVRLYRYRDRYQPSAQFASFLYHLARNVWADHGRKSFRVSRLLEGLSSWDTTSEPPATRGWDRSDIEAALDRLPPKLREAVVLTICQGLRYQDAADALGIPLGTVKSRVNLALNALKEILHED
jgi:RNA polymerase sigma-70 factor, ECF subfamily